MTIIVNRLYNRVDQNTENIEYRILITKEIASFSFPDYGKNNFKTSFFFLPLSRLLPLKIGKSDTFR